MNSLNDDFYPEDNVKQWEGLLKFKGLPVEPEFIFDCVGQGWHHLLNDLFCQLRKCEWDCNVSQVKEKFGLLRVYIEEGNEDMFGLLYEAEKQSRNICEFCGERGKTSGWGTGWKKTLCDKHGEMYRNRNLKI